MKKWIKITIFVSIGIVILIPLIFYFTNFHNGFSKDQSIWGNFGDFFGGTISPLLSTISFLLAIFVLIKNSQDDKFKNIHEFLKDFRSKEMSKDLKILWDFYKSDKIVENETKLQKYYKKEHANCSEIYYARRNVSYFFYQLGIFLFHNQIYEDLLFSIWPNYDTLEKIIIPCESSILDSAKKSNKFRYFNYLIEKSQEKNR